MRTLHLGPEELLVAAKIAVQHDDTAAEVAHAINAAEARIREAVPIARVIYLEPDIYTPRSAPAGRAANARQPRRRRSARQASARSDRPRRLEAPLTARSILIRCPHRRDWDGRADRAWGGADSLRWRRAVPPRTALMADRASEGLRCAPPGTPVPSSRGDPVSAGHARTNHAAVPTSPSRNTEETPE